MRYLEVVLLVMLGAGCGTDDDRPAAGSELGPCENGFCLAPLVCAPQNICVDAAQLGGDTDADDDADSIGSGTSGTTATPRGESTGGGGDTNADGGASDGGASDGGASDGGADGGSADSGDGYAPPPACVHFGETYCGCLGEAAVPACVSGSIESCANVYDACPSYWTCVNANLADCNLDTSVCSCD